MNRRNDKYGREGGIKGSRKGGREGGIKGRREGGGKRKEL